MQSNQDLIEDLLKELKKNEFFDVIGCLRNQRSKDSFPCAYVGDDKFIQGQPVSIPTNFQRNFLENIKPLIDPKAWIFAITQESLFNRQFLSKGFSPIEKDIWDHSNQPSMNGHLMAFTAEFPKTIFFFNIVYSKKKKMIPIQKNKMEANLSLYDSKMNEALEIPKMLLNPQLCKERLKKKS